MPYVDPSIILGAKPIEIPDTANMLMRALQMQNAQGANQLQGLQIQGAQRDADSQNKLMSLLQDPTFQQAPIDQQRAQLMTAGPQGLKYGQSLLDTQKTQGEIASAATSHDIALHVHAASVVGAAAAGGPQAVAAAVNSDNAIPPALKSQILADMQSNMGSPDAFNGWAQRTQSSGMTAEQQLTAGRPGVIESPTGPVSYNKANPNAGFTIMQPQGMPGAQPPPQAPPQVPGAPNGGFPAGTTLPQPTPSFTGSPQGDRLAILRQEQAAPERQNPEDQQAIAREIASLTGPQMQQVSARATGGAPVASATPVAAPAAPVISPFMKFETKTDPRTGGLVQISTTPGPDGKPVVIPVSGGNDEGTGLVSPAAIDNAAKRYNLDGTLPPTGMGTSGNLVRSQILNRAADLAQGTDGTDQRVSQLDAKGASAALSKLTTQQAAISSFEKTANMNAQMALDMSNKLDRTGVPILNAGLQFARTNSGSPEAAQFHAAVATFVGEYAKVMSGGTSGPTSDAARAKAGSLLTESMTQPQFAAVVKTLQQEMDNRMAGFSQQADELRARMRGQPVGGNAVPADILAIMQKHGITQ